MFRVIEKSQTLLVNEQSRLREREGQEVFKLGFGQSPFLPPLHVREALALAVDRKDYAPVKGLAELCDAVATFHGQVDARPVVEGQVLIGPGSKILLYNTLLAFEQADVFIPAPAWVSYAPQARLIGHRVHLLPTSWEQRWRVEPDVLESALRRSDAVAKVLILNYPGNPEGLTYRADELNELAQVARKYGVWILSDEIYGLLHHEGQHVSVAHVYPEKTLVTTGLSKWCGAGGWRLGVQILPEQTPPALKEALLGIASETYSCAPTPVQVAACTAYQLDARIQTYLARQRRVLRCLGQEIQRQLKVSGMRVHAPQGGFYVLVDASPLRSALLEKGLNNDQQMCAALVEETGVALLPGSAFGLPEEAYTARLAYVDFDGEPLLERADAASDAEILAGCAKMMRGIERLAQWLA